MDFKNLSIYLQKLESTSSRLEITGILAQLFRELSPEEIDKSVYLILGFLAPGYSGVVFGMAEKMVIRAIAQAYRVSTDVVGNSYKKLGDLGETAQNLVSGNGHKVSVSEVYGALWDIARQKGDESQERKVLGTADLLLKLDPQGAKYVVRIILGKLRLGFSDKTILDALSWMESKDKSGKKYLEDAYNILPDVGALAVSVKKLGVKRASLGVSAKIGIPLLPMLAARLKSPKEMIDKMGRVFVEPKFDGLRIQIHFKKVTSNKVQVTGDTRDEIQAFTRNLRETSWMFPELSKISSQIKAKEVILDSEAVGVDEERKAMASFQTTMGRRRKHDIEEMAKKVSIRFNVFDIMYKDGQSLVHTPYDQRRKILAETVVSGGILEAVPFEETKDPERINELMQEELKGGLEGIIVKKADSGYIAGRTGFRWVKMKEKESQKAKMADTIDAVVMGYYRGKGKRVGFGLGGFLVGVRDGDEIKSLTKIGTGLTDQQFKDLSALLKDLETKEKPSQYDEVAKSHLPDVWVEPKVVTEIAADEITKSPIHASGFALRFPRLVRIRGDKGIENSTSVSEIKSIYKLQ